MPRWLSKWRSNRRQHCRRKPGRTPEFDALQALEPRILLANVQGVIYNDLDNSGGRDGGEPGLAGIRVYADLNSNFAFDEGTEPSTMSTGDGTYDLADVPVGNTFIRQVKPGGFDQTQPFAPNQNALSGYAVSVQNESDVFTDRDFGNFETAPATSSIGDFVWIDALENDVQDVGERGLEGVTVRLFEDGNGIPIRTTTTDADGAYLFDNLVAGDYFVEFVRPQGFVFVTQGAGTDTDSDANVNTGRSLTFAVAEDEAKTDIDAGLVAAQLFVTIDYSLDTGGFYDDPAVRARLQQALDALVAPLNDDLDPITPQGGNTWSATFTHPSTGQPHQVDDLFIARNEIVVYAGARDLGGGVGQGELGGTTSGGSQAFQDTVAARGQTGALLATPTDIGIWGGAISFDTNTLFHFGATTAGLELTEVDFRSAATHEGAHVLGFGTHPAFDRHVDTGNNRFLGPASIGQHDGAGAPPLDPSGDHWEEGLTDGGVETAMDPTLDLGFRKLFTQLDFAALADTGWEVQGLSDPADATIGDRVFIDLDGDGNFDPSEDGFDGVTVELFRDDNANGMFEAGEKVAELVTDNNGIYDFTNLPAGEYRVNVPTDQPALGGFNATLPNPVDVTLIASQDFNTADFGFQFDGGVSVTVFEDADIDTVFDPGELGIGNVTLALIRDVNGDGLIDGGDVIVDQKTTDVNGEATLLAQEPGDHIITVTDLNNSLLAFTLTTNNEPTTLVIDDNPTPDVLFGYEFTPNVVTAQITAEDDNANEPDNDGLFRLTVDEAPTDNRTFNLSITGTADNGTDYATINTFAIVPQGQTFVDIPLEVFDDFTEEDDETVTITILPGPGYNVGASGDATITIADNDQTPEVTIVATAPNAFEGGSPAVLTFTRTGFTDFALDVFYGISGNAQVGSDFQPFGTNVQIPIGETSVTVEVNAVDDEVIEDDKSVIVTLANNAAYDIGQPSNATVTIVNDDLPEVAIEATDNFASEAGQEPAEYTFTRTGPLGNTLTVEYTISGAATNTADFNTIADSIEFGVGQATTTLVITPVDDQLAEGFEDLTLTLDNIGTYAITAPGSATVVLDDDDVPRNAAVGDKVFHDLNADGIQDTGEPGVAGATVDLLNALGILSGSTVTDADGAFLFDLLPAGGYSLRVTPPAGFQFSPQNATLDQDADSDADPATGETPLFNLADSQTDLSRDIGLFANGSISGVKFNDDNGNGVRDLGEQPRQGVTIYIDSNNNGALDAGEPETTSDVSGNYAFNDLAPGVTYHVREVLDIGFAQTGPEYATELNAANEVQNPAVDSPATGFATFSLDDATNTLAFEVHFANLIGDTTMLHIHRGGAGVNGPVAYDLEAIAGLSDGFTSPVTGTIDLANDLLLGGVSVQDILTDLDNGDLYVNLHTSSFGSGEVRGQVEVESSHVVPLASNQQVTDRNFGNQLEAPDIAVTLGGQPIDNGQAEAVDFGTVLTQSGDVAIQFNIINAGTDLLTLGAIQLPDGFELDPLDTPLSNIGPGFVETMTVILPSDELGVFSGDIVIPSNDPDENPFTFPITGTVTDIVSEELFTNDLGDYVIVTGDVQQVNGQAQLAESSDAAMSVTLDLPENVAELTFDFTFDDIGDGDSLVATITVGGETTTLFDRPAADFAQGVPQMSGEIDLTQFAGAQDAVLEFRLVSAGAVNAQVSIDNVRIKASNFIDLIAQGRDKVEYVDGQGNDVTVSISGNGTAIVRVPDIGNQPVGDAFQISVTGSDDRTSLSVSVKGPTGITRVGRIIVEGSVNQIKADKVDLSRELTVTGIAKNVRLHDVTGEATITVEGQGADDRDKTTYQFNVINDLVLISGIAINSFTATEWTDTPGSTRDLLQGTSLNRMTIKGNSRDNVHGRFEADLDLEDPDARMVLGNTSIAGPVDGVMADIIGDVGNLTFKSSVSNSTFMVASKVNKFGVSGSMTDVDLVFDEFGTLQAAEWIGGSLTANFGKTADIRGDNRNDIDGDITNVTIALNGPPPDSRARSTLSNFKTKGDANNLMFTTVGEATNVAIGGNINTAVLTFNPDGGEPAGANKVTGDNVTGLTLTGGDFGTLQFNDLSDSTFDVDSIKQLQTRKDNKSGAAGDITNVDIDIAGSTNTRVRDDLGSIKGDGAVEDLDVDVQGSSGTVDLRGAVNDLIVNISEALKTLRLGLTAQASVNAGSTGNVQAVRWLTGDAVFLDAKNVKITGDRDTEGDFGANLTVNAPGTSTARSQLGGATIDGTASNMWRVTGESGNITGGAFDNTFDAVFEGEVRGLTSKAEFDGFAAAFAFGKVDVKTTMTGATIIAGGPMGSALPNDIGTFKVGGNVTGGTMVIAGVDPGADNSFLTLDPGDFKGGDDNFIKSITIGGTAPTAGDVMFTAGAFPKTASINKGRIDPLTDGTGRFVLTV